ncbi:MAG: iron-containing alcohol dehydrogenase [Deltaproteobacteria bacterium]|nr:MAG: iron-containing alcohol dehydrogenase [Deltaproteobacteria bacterium]
MKDLICIEGVKKTLFGAGSLDQIAEECKALKGSKALLVIDRGLSKTDIRSRVEERLRKARIRTLMYPEVTPEPSPALADDGAKLARKEKVSCVIGIGGGSTMDVAKAIAILVKNEGKAVDYIGLGLVKKPGLPSIMVPTTAGTGSEVTFTSVFTMRETKSKGGINSPYLYPHTAILDPELTLGLSPEVTAYTGMDALTHAIESFTSLQAHFMSEPISYKAIETISSNLRGAVFNGDDYRFRENMMQGSYLAGLGLAISGVGAVHALAYPLGALFDIPHGIANALMLPYVLEYNYPGNMDKFSLIAVAMEEGDTFSSTRKLASRAAQAVFDLAADIGIPRTLKEINIPEDAIPEMAEGAMKVTRPIENNPRPMTVSVAEEIYRKAYEGR